MIGQHDLSSKEFPGHYSFLTGHSPLIGRVISSPDLRIKTLTVLGGGSCTQAIEINTTLQHEAI